MGRHRPPPARERLRAPLRPQHHRRRRQDHQEGERGGALGRRGGRASTPRRCRSTSARSVCCAARPRAARDRAHRRDDRHHSPAGGEGPGLRGRRRRLLRGAGLRRLRQASRPEHRRSRRRARASRSTSRRSSPLDFALWKGGQARRAVLAEPVGPRPPRLAHRVLGDGAPLPRRAVRHPRRRRRPHLPAPRKRDRPVRGAFGAGNFARHWMHPACSRWAGRRCRSRSATSSPSARSPRRTISRRCACCSSASTTGARSGSRWRRTTSSGRSTRSSTRPRSGWTTSTGRWRAWRRRPPPTTRARSSRGRKDAFQFPGSYGRRLQRRRRRRPAL